MKVFERVLSWIHEDKPCHISCLGTNFFLKSGRLFLRDCTGTMAWVSGNDLKAHGVKLFDVSTFYQLKKPVDKLVSLPIKLVPFNFLEMILR